MAALQRLGRDALTTRLLRRRTLNQHIRRAARRPAPPLPPLSDPVSLEVVVPAYNHAAYLEEATRSIYAQTYEGEFGVVFVDDASTDDTPAILDRLVADAAPDRIAVRRLRNPRNRRQWFSLNRAAGSSGADLLMVLNDDDLLLPDAVEKIVALFRAHPDAGLAGAHSLWLEGDGPAPQRDELPLDAVRRVRSEPAEALLYERLNDLNLTHSSSAFRREAWRAAGGYAPKRRRIHPDAPEDRDFQMRVAALYPVITMPEYALAIWRTGSSHGHDY